MVIPVTEHLVHTFALGGSRVWDQVDLKMEDRQEDLGILVLGLCVLDPFVKLRIVDMLKCTTHTFYVLDISFHE